MKPEARYKQPYESEIYEIECQERIPTGAAISTVAASVFDEKGTDVSSAMIEGVPSFSGTKGYVQIKAGESGKKYNLRFRLVLDNGEKAEDDIKVIVGERK